MIQFPRLSRLFHVSLCLLAISGPSRADELGDKIHALIQGPDYKFSRWGLLVVERDSGRVVFAHHPDQLCVPASVTKLYSCAAALIALGPEHRFATPVHRRGDVVEGVLRGDLILVAAGDLTLGGRTQANGNLAFRDVDHIYANWLTRGELTKTDPLTGLQSLAMQVKTSGIREITGDVLVDNRLFPQARGSGSGPDVISPIIVNDNVIDVTIKPGATAGEPATIQTRPATDFLVLDAQVSTAAEGQPVHTVIEHVGPQHFTLRGQVPAGGKPLVRFCPFDDPAKFARALFIESLRREGIRLPASIYRQPTVELPDQTNYGKLPRVAVHRSEPFAEDIKVTLKVSHNLYAGTLPILLTMNKKSEHTLAAGLKEQGRILKELGVDVSAVSFDSGAGGGSADRVTPRATVQLLQLMAKRPEFPAFKAGLPILGVDGTTAEAVDARSPARGKVFAKTGTYVDGDALNDRMLLRSKALAGYLTTASGAEMVFAIFVNDTPLPAGVDSAREGKVLGKICELLHRHAPSPGTGAR